MKVYVDDDGWRLVGRTDVPEDCGPVYEVRLSGAAPTVVEGFSLIAVARIPAGGGAPVLERGVLLAPGQPAELLPGWAPLAS